MPLLRATLSAGSPGFGNTHLQGRPKSPVLIRAAADERASPAELPTTAVQLFFINARGQVGAPHHRERRFDEVRMFKMKTKEEGEASVPRLGKLTGCEGGWRFGGVLQAIGIMSRPVFAALVLCLMDCQGVILFPTPPNEASIPVAATEVLPPFAPSPASLRLLTVSQYEESIRAILGNVSVPKVTGTHLSIEASTAHVSAATVEEYEAAALEVARQAFADLSLRQSLVGCTPKAAVGDACAQRTLKQIGRLAFRRSLSREELAQYEGVAQAGAVALSPWEGLELAVAALFQSPHFLYRVELGTQAGQDPKVLTYAPHEMATRLAYFFWNVGPDAALLDAADRGELQTVDDLRATAAKMLNDARSAKGLQRIFQDWFKLDALSYPLDKDPATFPQNTPTLGPAMLKELTLKLSDIALSDASDFNDIIDSDVTYVNDELAALYQLPKVPAGNFSRIVLPADGARTGLLGSAGLLALLAKPTKTFPTERGIFVLEQLLCQSAPSPPPGVNPTLNLDPNGPPKTRRQQLQGHLADATCAACHRRMDSIGLAFEEFDGIGAFRSTENGLDIDPSGVFDGVAFRDARELQALVKQAPNLPDCTVRQVFKVASGHANTQDERAPLKRVTDRYLAVNRNFKTLLIEVVVSDAFRFAAPPSQ